MVWCAGIQRGGAPARSQGLPGNFHVRGQHDERTQPRAAGGEMPSGRTDVCVRPRIARAIEIIEFLLSLACILFAQRRPRLARSR